MFSCAGVDSLRVEEERIDRGKEGKRDGRGDGGSARGRIEKRAMQE